MAAEHDQWADVAEAVAVAIHRARSEGKDDIDQTGAAVRAVMAVRPELTASQALTHVRRFRG